MITFFKMKVQNLQNPLLDRMTTTDFDTSFKDRSENHIGIVCTEQVFPFDFGFINEKPAISSFVFNEYEKRQFYLIPRTIFYISEMH